jgi:hypothetical protein
MINKILLGITIAVVFAIGITSAVNFATSTSDAKSYKVEPMLETPSSLMAFADSSSNGIISLTVNPDYGATSTFDVNSVKCKTTTKNLQTTVKWCKATATMSKPKFQDFVTAATIPTNWNALVQAIEASPTDFDKILVNYEIGLLTQEIQNSLSTQYPGITLPSDYKHKSVDMEWTVQKNKGVETSETELSMEIDF